MTDTEANQAAVEPVADEATPPPPEPWTPQRVIEKNAYYDVYVAAFVLALAFLGSAHKIQSINSGLWSYLQAGRQIVEAGSPIGLASLTLAGEGQRWVNVPWLFELVHFLVYKNILALAPPPNPGMPTMGGALAIRGEQAATGALIALSALVRALTAFLLLRLRHKGPGLWWTALCVTAALGITLSPEPVEAIALPAGGEAVRVVVPAIGIQLGGIAGVAAVAPETWGLLLLALELLLLHQAINLGKPGRIYTMIPLSLVWANLDEMFGLGLLVLALAALGRAIDHRPSVARSLTAPVGVTPQALLITLVGSFGATFLNPSHVFGVLAGFGVLVRSVGLAFGPPSPVPTSIFGASLVAQFGPGFAQAFRIYYLILVLAGLGSFALNRRRFAWSRFLVFAMVSLVCGLSLVYTAGFAAVLAGVLALNGQEWYHDTLGTEGRLGGGWVFWSTGGRLLTIGVIFGAIFQATTGWGGQVGGSRFGFGFDPDDFPFEAADTAAATPIAGNFLNTTLAQGDALVWRTAGKRKAYLDSKAHLYSPEVLREFEELRRLIRDDKAAEWAPILDRSQIAAVMIQTANAPRTYAQLMDSPNWVPFHDDGSVSMFGRTDSKADPADVAYFQANRLDATELAFQRPKPVPPWFGTPRAVSELVDSVFQNRLLNRTPPHVDAAQHWLRPVTVPAGSLYMPDPAHCLLAIRELRSALSSKPDDYTAFRLLAEAYRLLLAEESALLAGIEPTQANIERILKAAPQPRLLSIRVRQLLTALNFSILTMPPSKTSEDRLERVQLNYSIAQLDIQTGALDLARERLLAILAVETRPGELTEAFLKDLTKLLGDLNQRIEGVQTQINDLTIQRRASPLEKANFARTSGAQGLAILELVEANEAGSGQGLVRPTLLDLYADTGQPEKALDLVANLNIDDPTLSTGVGTATYRQGLVYFLVGDYANAISLWIERTIPQIETMRLTQGPIATQALLRGEPAAATRMFIELPEKVDQQAAWEFELGLAALEGGLPSTVAADHLRKSLELEPNLAIRPVIAYYLGQLGQTVPPPRPISGSTPTNRATPSATAPIPASPTPDRPTSELPSDPFAPSSPPDAPK